MIPLFEDQHANNNIYPVLEEVNKLFTDKVFEKVSHFFTREYRTPRERNIYFLVGMTLFDELRRVKHFSSRAEAELENQKWGFVAQTMLKLKLESAASNVLSLNLK